MMQGVDSASRLGDNIAALLAAHGIKFAGRYYSFDAVKNLTLAEARQLAAAGISIVAIWEADGDTIAGFDAISGDRAGSVALRLAAACGQPVATPIYFAVDFDASAEDIAGKIAEYFAAVGKRLHPAGYSTGVYGSGLVCKTLLGNGLAHVAYLAQSRGWRGTPGFAEAAIKQGPRVTIAGVPVDLCEALAAPATAGLWQPPGIPPAMPAPEVDPVRAAIVALQTELHDAGFYHAALDGIWGEASAAALEEWQRREA